MYEFLTYTVSGIAIGVMGGLLCLVAASRIGIAGHAVKTKYSELPRPTLLKYIAFILFFTVYGLAVSPIHGWMLFAGSNTFIFIFYSLAKKFYR